MFYSLNVLNVQKETSDSISIEFEVPKKLAKHFSFKAGQFLTLKKNINNQEIRRSYSICSTPNSGKFKIVIKKIPNGKFSTYVVNKLKIGDFIDVAKPSGNFFFTSQSKSKKSYTLIAAGSGITPIFSILKTILFEEPNSTVKLFYGNKLPELTIFKQKIEKISRIYSEKLTVHFIYSQIKGKSRFHNGRIEGKKIKKIFTKMAPINLTDEVFICGPQEMTSGIYNLITNKFNFDPSSIHYELFKSNTIEKQSSVKAKKTSRVIATIDGEIFEFIVKKNESILEAGLAAGYEIPFSCQGGVCGVCKCTSGEGKTEMSNSIALSDDEIKSGIILSCQAKVLSPYIKVNFDSCF